ncbi:MAG: hemolysin III family protein [Deltaproteobacteria bacterium]|nr:hemolysin III family protein [Deltaproteobacteria bacterium]
MNVYPIPGFSDPASSLTHLGGGGVFLVLGVMLVRKGARLADSSRMWRVAALGLFAFAAVAQLGISGAYHLLSHEGLARLVMQRIDHAAIFFLIMASFFPLHAILFTGWRRWLILLLLAAMAATGITLKTIYFTSLPDWAGLVLYVAMGWVGGYSGWMLYRRIGWPFISPLVWGGVAYTLGGIVEVLGWPVVIQGVLGPHELFHVAVLAGLGFHFKFTFSFADPTETPKGKAA